MSDNKAKIAITIDPLLLERLDAVADLRGQSRSAVIERIIRNEIKTEEEFVRDMESPVMRTIMATMSKTPGVMEAIAKMIGDNMTREDVEKMRDGLKEQAARGKERAATKKTTKKKAKPA